MNNVTRRLKTTELVPGLGVKVDVDVVTDLRQSVKDELLSLFNEYHLLFIEAPNLSAERQLEIMEIFGTAIAASPDGNLELTVSNAVPEGYLGKFELVWHIDGSFMPEPFLASCLYGLDLKDGISSTRYVNVSSAIDRLPKELKDKMEYLQVINTVEVKTERGKRVETHGSDLIAAAHRLISPHPIKGIPYITANAYQTDCIIGLNGDESSAFLNELFEHMYSSEFVYEHWWCKNQLVIWDNLMVQHARGDVSDVGTRTLRRYTVGPAPAIDQLPDKQREWLTTNFYARKGPDGQHHAA